MTSGRAEPNPRQRFRAGLRRTLRQRTIVIGGSILLLLVLAAIVGPHVSPYQPNRLTSAFLKRPSAVHWFGTDNFGRDVLTRVLYGARMSIGIGLTTAVCSSILGTVLGMLAGSSKRFDPIIMRLMDVIMAFPSLLLAMAVLAALGRNAVNILIALSIVYTPRTARIVRSSTLSVREEVYIEAARALAIPWWRVLGRHILPNVLAALIVQATFVFAYGVLAEAGLSFIGVGIQPPAASLGNMLGDGRSIIREAPWMSFFPGGFIFALVMAINLMGDGLRELFDPRLRKR